MDTTKEAEILQMQAAGMKPAAIATELELAITTVRGVLRKHVPQVVAVVDEEAVVSEYTKSVPVGEILREHGISYATLYRILADHDIPTRVAASTVGRHLQMQAAIDLYKAGTPLWQILEETGVPQPTLHNELHLQGIPLRRPRRHLAQP
jgi:hypothetical protein